MAILNWRDHPRLRFVDFPPPFLTKGSVYIAEDRGDTAWISDGTTYLQLYPDTNLVPQEYTWATRPAPGSPGRVIRVSDVGPAPGIEMVDSGTSWRPRGGRQVIAMRAADVTIQNLGYQIIETLGPFPGGLIQQGMAIETDAIWRLPAVSTTNRKGQIAIGNTPQSAANTTNSLNGVDFAASSSAGGYRGASILSAKNNTNGPHPVGLVYVTPFGIDSGVNAVYFLTVDFSAPWYITIIGRSVAETAVNISSATWAGGIATFNTAADHTLAVGDKTVIASVTPSGWNIPAGAIVLSVPTSTQFTVALAADPGAYTSGGTSSRISNVTSQSYVLTLVG